jgi:hypothetical protein
MPNKLLVEFNMINWIRLSYVEMASGIEVYYVSKLFRNSPQLHKNILKHSLDEYRHSGIFRNFAKEDRSIENLDSIPTPNYLIKTAGLGGSKLSLLEKNILKACAYLYVGEYRAIEFNNDCKKIINQEHMIKQIKEIEQDELGHASGVMRFMEKFPFYKYKHYILLYKIRYFFQKIGKRGLVRNLQNKTIRFLASFLLSRLPKSILKFEKKNITLTSSINSSDLLL